MDQESSVTGPIPAHGQSSRRPRQLWNHVYEKHVFSEQELLLLKAPERRKVYVASLESHINRLHEQLKTMGIWPVPFEKLDEYYGLNSKIAKSMVTGLQQDVASANWTLAGIDHKMKQHGNPNEVATGFAKTACKAESLSDSET